ncbi:Carboxymuconolactone decarboxylase [Denitrovibrio acetiphilus DSM 12809]|uniref:Carboxymuconolactone decarboxylase n=1 Tax=Denitrovibrio acetiphilus (strain DSM 12809 / NBRC 114555 / N2460) TaxID=522772 RepID=D4H6L3_DENA2|nr:carboxymuconolactone decarboxylase family protein [Denitrovibrio acetiphilus]ADD69687.1 Carboxymuconolactone decarboxylase [Denitrovibrio acetiphilus DSM 12809]
MSIIEKYETTRKGFWDYLGEVGETNEIFQEHYTKSYAPGIISAKNKRLMGMVGAAVAGCEGCMLGQVTHAIAEGATRAEIVEACAVAFSLGGTMAGSKISLIIQFMDEKEIK